jgi:hypothetical protein
MLKKISHAVIRWVLNGIFSGFYRLHVEGAENIPDTGAVIVAPNHKSNFDPPIVGVAIKNRLVHYMAKAELFKNPMFGWVLRKMGAFPVKRGTVDRIAIKQAVRELKNGHVLGIFPEGTRIKKDDLGRFHSGMASLALMTGVPIVPVAVLGTRTLPKKKETIVILIGEPVVVEKQKVNDDKVAELNDRVKQEIEKLISDYQGKH